MLRRRVVFPRRRGRSASPPAAGRTVAARAPRAAAMLGRVASLLIGSLRDARTMRASRRPADYAAEYEPSRRRGARAAIAGGPPQCTAGPPHLLAAGGELRIDAALSIAEGSSRNREAWVPDCSRWWACRCSARTRCRSRRASTRPGRSTGRRSGSPGAAGRCGREAQEAGPSCRPLREPRWEGPRASARLALRRRAPSWRGRANRSRVSPARAGPGLPPGAECGDRGQTRPRGPVLQRALGRGRSGCTARAPGVAGTSGATPRSPAHSTRASPARAASPAKHWMSRHAPRLQARREWRAALPRANTLPTFAPDQLRDPAELPAALRRARGRRAARGLVAGLVPAS